MTSHATDATTAASPSAHTLRRPRLVPQPRPQIMSETQYRERLDVLLHTDRCRPVAPWVSADVARPELVWEHVVRAPSQPMETHKSSHGSGLVARMKTEGESSLSLGRGEDSCGRLPAWRSPSPAVPRGRTDQDEPVNVVPDVYTISDEDQEAAQEVEVSQMRQSSTEQSASSSVARHSPVPKRQLPLRFTSTTTTTTTTKTGDAAPTHESVSVHAGVKRPAPVEDVPSQRRRSHQPRASSSGSSVLVLSAMPEPKKAKAVPPTGTGSAAEKPLPRTMEEFLRSDN